MENASKALIIAGAILISILIIGLGVFIYQKVSTQVGDNTDLSEYELQAFNSKFEKYEGTQKGSSVLSLISTINANNGANSKVKLTSSKTGVTVSGDENKGYSANIKSGDTYEISILRTGGRITEIKIK